MEAAEAINAITYRGGMTNTAAALRHLRTNMLTEANGDRHNVTNFAVIITDGASNTPDKQVGYIYCIEVKTGGQSVCPSAGLMLILHCKFTCIKTRHIDMLSAEPCHLLNPFKPEFTIVIFILYKPRIAVAILDL